MKKAIHYLLMLTFPVFALILIYLLFFNHRGFYGSSMSFWEHFKFSSNLVPFKTITMYTNDFLNARLNRSIPFRNLAGNVVLFIPWGIYIPFLFKKNRALLRFILTMFILLLSIEVLQITLRRGMFDIDDIILNMAGALIGYAFWSIPFIKRLLTK